MEKMDYEDNTDDTDGYHDNTAKKCRLSSYESSTASLQSVQSSSSSFNPASSQVYTGNFESVSIFGRHIFQSDYFILESSIYISE